MIATGEDPVSPHESTSKDAAFPGASMVRINAIKEEIKEDRAKHHEQDEEHNQSGSDESDYEDDEEEERHSAEFQQLTLESLDGDGLADVKIPGTEAKAEAKDPDTPPVKRVLRRKRKRMSEDERRIRHREVQRQFMKRKRARLGEMRKVLRGLEAHHRLVKASNERAMLEKENAELVDRLAAPGSGYEWDDAPAETQEEKPQASADPHVVYLVPEHGHLAFHHQTPHHLPSQPQYDSSGMQLHWHYPPMYHTPAHHQLQSPHALASAPHGVAHRPAAPGVILPWDDILDAVTGESVDISF